MKKVEDREMAAFKKGRKRKILKSELKWEGIIERSLKSVGKSARDRIFASSAGLCERQTAGLMLLFDERGSARRASTQFYFKIGQAFEDVMSRAFQKFGIELDRETRIEAYHPELPVSGRIDFVLSDPEDDEIVLVELKTCGKLPTQPKAVHMAQLLVYLLLTGMPKGLLWYVSRTVAGWDGDLRQIVFEVEPSEEERRETALRVALGALFAKKGLLPDVPAHMRKYKCGFCPLIPLCWSGEDVGVKAKEATAEQKLELMDAANSIANEVMGDQAWLKEEFETAIKS